VPSVVLDRVAEKPATTHGSRRLPLALLSPLVAFPALWALAVALAQIHVTSIQGPWSATVWWVVALVPASFVGGGLLATFVVGRRVAWRQTVAVDARVSRGILVALLAIGYAELAREFGQAGVVPLLSGHIDATRVSIQSSGWSGLLVNALTVCAIAAIALPRTLTSRAALPEITIAVLALAGSAASGGRGVFVVVAAALIARALYWGPPRLRSVVLGAAFGVALFSLVFYIRTGQETSQAFAQHFYQHVVPGTFAPLVPLLPVDLSLGVNVDVLAHVIGYFPHSKPFGHGSYDAWSIHSLVPARRLQSLTTLLTPPWVVSTAAGPLWADDGFIAVAIGCLLIGALTTGPYAIARRTGRAAHALVAGYAVAVACYCVYDNLITQYKDWIVIAPALFAIGLWAERHSLAGPSTEADTPVPSWVSRLRPAIAVAALAGTAAIWFAVVAVAASDVNGARASQRRMERLAASVTPMSALASGPGWVRLGPNSAVRRLVADPRARSLLADPLAAASMGGTKRAVWAFSNRGVRLEATPLAIAGRSVNAGRAISLGRVGHVAGTQYAVGRWGDVPNAAFVLTPIGSRVLIRVLALSDRAVLLADTRTAPIRAARGSRRVLAITSPVGSPTELVVVDRGGAGGVLRMTTFSAASDFRTPTRRASYRGYDFPAPNWTVSVGAAESNGPDLIFLGNQSSAPSAKQQIHILLSSSDYSHFGAQTQFDVIARGARRIRFLVGPVGLSPTLYAVDAARRRM
jgi:hypothetical protein